MGWRRRGRAVVQAQAFAGALGVVVWGRLHAARSAAFDVLGEVIGGVVREVRGRRVHVGRAYATCAGEGDWGGGKMTVKVDVVLGELWRVGRRVEQKCTDSELSSRRTFRFLRSTALLSQTTLQHILESVSTFSSRCLSHIAEYAPARECHALHVEPRAN